MTAVSFGELRRQVVCDGVGRVNIARTNAHQPADRQAAPHRDHAQAFCAELELEHDLTEEDDVATPREKRLDQTCAGNRE